MLYVCGVEAAKNAKLVQILDWIVDHKRLDLDNKQKFDTLRQLRNAYAHFRPPLHEEGFIRRTVEVEDSVNGIIKADAEFALRAVISFLNNRPDF